MLAADGESRPRSRASSARLLLRAMLMTSASVRFFGKRRSLRSQAHPRAQQVDHVLHVGAVEDREIGLESDRRAEAPQHQIGERMERAAGHRPRAIADQLLHPAQHLLRRAPGESQQQDRSGRHAALDQPGDPINQRAGLARARSGDHQQRALAMPDGFELRRVQDLGVLDPEVALVRRRRGVSLEGDYLVGHFAADPIMSGQGPVSVVLRLR